MEALPRVTPQQLQAILESLPMRQFELHSAVGYVSLELHHDLQ
jgi:hypothetical protein